LTRDVSTASNPTAYTNASINSPARPGADPVHGPDRLTVTPMTSRHQRRRCLCSKYLAPDYADKPFWSTILGSRTSRVPAGDPPF